MAVKNHENGRRTRSPSTRMKIRWMTVLGSVMVADPLHILDCSPITDGAAAAMLCPADMAKKLGKKGPVKIIGSGTPGHHRPAPAGPTSRRLPAVAKSAHKAYTMAGQAAQGHPALRGARLLHHRRDHGHGGSGLLPRTARAASGTAEGADGLGGKIPINTSGGLKSKGHPVGATGVAQVVELATQLRGLSDGTRLLCQIADCVPSAWPSASR